MSWDKLLGVPAQHGLIPRATAVRRAVTRQARPRRGPGEGSGSQPQRPGPPQGLWLRGTFLGASRKNLAAYLEEFAYGANHRDQDQEFGGLIVEQALGPTPRDRSDVGPERGKEFSAYG